MGKFLVALAACVVPLVVAAHLPSGDIFSYWKMVVIISIGALSMVLLNSVLGLIIATFFIFAIVLDPYPKPTLFETSATYVAYFSIFALSVKYARPWLLPFLAVSSVVVAAVGLSQFFGLRPIVWFIEATTGGVVQYNSITSTLHSENYIGHYCAMVIPLFAVMAAEKSHWYWIPTGGLAALLMISLSWLGVLGVGASFVLYLCLPGPGLLPRLYAFAALIVVICSFIVWKTPAGAVDILTRVVQKANVVNVDNTDKLFGSRGYIWRGSARATKLWPQGPGNLSSTFRHNPVIEKRVGLKPLAIIDRPHSMYLQIAHSFGWWGLILFLFAVCTLALKSTGDPFPPSERAFLTGCWLGVVGFHFAGVFNDGGPSIWPVYAVLLGAGVSRGYEFDPDIVR